MRTCANQFNNVLLFKEQVVELDNNLSDSLLRSEIEEVRVEFKESENGLISERFLWVMV